MPNCMSEVNDAVRTLEISGKRCALIVECLHSSEVVLYVEVFGFAYGYGIACKLRP